LNCNVSTIDGCSNVVGILQFDVLSDVLFYVQYMTCMTMILNNIKIFNLRQGLRWR
jgi:hypothetical protein